MDLDQQLNWKLETEESYQAGGGKRTVRILKADYKEDQPKRNFVLFKEEYKNAKGEITQVRYRGRGGRLKFKTVEALIHNLTGHRPE